MRRILFYFRHAITNLRNSGHWTVFAIFCVAAGVATVVALRSLGLSITDSLLGNLRQYNHGDILMSAVESFGPFSGAFQRGEDEPSVFRSRRRNLPVDWTAEHNGQLTMYTLVSNIQITAMGVSGVGRPQFISSYLIDPQTFDIAGPIVALDPPGVPPHRIAGGDFAVVISRNLAESQNLKVGDQVRVSGTEQPFTVAGIVPTETEANINNILAAFFGFVYFDQRYAEMLQLNTNPNHIGVVLPDGTTSDQIKRQRMNWLPQKHPRPECHPLAAGTQQGTGGFDRALHRGDGAGGDAHRRRGHHEHHAGAGGAALEWKLPPSKPSA